MELIEEEEDASNSPTTSAPRPSLVLSQSSKALLGSNSSKSLKASNSSKALLISNSNKSLVSTSGKRLEPSKKYVRQVTGRLNDTELHLAAQRGDNDVIKDILGEIDAQMMRTTSSVDFDAEVAEIRVAVVEEVNELGETALFIAAKNGHLDVVKELLQYMTKEGVSLKSNSGLDPLHVAASQGYQDIVRVLLDHYPELTKTFGQSNATPLITAATKGHIDVLHVLLSKDPHLLKIPRSNGKNALHLAARQGHVDVVKHILKKDTQLARHTDKKGQTALHMAVKGISSEVVRLLLGADSAIAMLPDKFGNTALHVATRKKRIEIVNELLALPDIDVNILTKDRKTALDIAEGLPFSEETAELKECLERNGAVRARELNQPRDELRRTVKEIKQHVHTQLEQTRKTNKNVQDIAKHLRKLHKFGLYNATNSVTVVAVLFATVAFASIFTLPGGDRDDGSSVVASTIPFKIFYVANAFALFFSLAVVLVQITIVRGELKSERRVTKVINKLMWLASICTSVAFTSSSYIVVGRHNRWAAIFITAVGGVTMVGILSFLTYYAVISKRRRAERKREKLKRKGRESTLSGDDSDFYNFYVI
ncbi:ANK REP REGION domain-containing protein [Citrus sinensis]|uniref:ANK REP REGION domain-containing protein n=1 Tax=Citrus sinensis TaxID=2711 RepID=A0ACB8JT67_CITSI|nr:ANK REP REGION domain-containing protein [Citrus sinensis]